MSAYAILQININNQENYKKYLSQVTKIVKKYQGQYIVRGAKFEVVLGNFFIWTNLNDFGFNFVNFEHVLITFISFLWFSEKIVIMFLLPIHTTLKFFLYNSYSKSSKFIL